MADKGAGRGRGKFTGAGVQADQEARLTAVEDYLAGLIEDGTLPEPEVEVEEPVVEVPVEEPPSA